MIKNIIGISAFIFGILGAFSIQHMSNITEYIFLTIALILYIIFKWLQINEE